MGGRGRATPVLRAPRPRSYDCGCERLAEGRSRNLAVAGAAGTRCRNDRFHNLLDQSSLIATSSLNFETNCTAGSGGTRMGGLGDGGEMGLVSTSGLPPEVLDLAHRHALRSPAERALVSASTYGFDSSCDDSLCSLPRCLVPLTGK